MDELQEHQNFSPLKAPFDMFEGSSSLQRKMGQSHVEAVAGPLDPRNLRRRKRQYLVKHLKTVLRFQPLPGFGFMMSFSFVGKIGLVCF